MLGTALYTIVTGVMGTPWTHAARIREILLYRKLIKTNTLVEVECSVACHAAAVEWAVFVTTDLKKFTSYKDAIKSNI